MRTRLRRSALRAVVAASLAAVVAGTAPVTAPAAAAAPTPEPPATALADEDVCAGTSEESPVDIEVRTLLPRAPMQPDEPFQITGRLRNCGSEPLRALELRLGVGPVLKTRGELQRAAEEPVLGTTRFTGEPAAQLLAPGEVTDFDLRLPVGELGLRSLGNYPLSLQARGRYGDDAARTPVGLASTFVPWFPDGPPAPTRIAWLWPLVDQPRRAPAEVMLDNVLEELVADRTAERPRGRLRGLLAAARDGVRGACDEQATPPDGTPRAPATPCRGEPVPLTYGVDPSLLYSIEAMVAPRGYSVLVDGKKVDLPMSQSAEEWLVSMRAAARESDVLALPFGDPDVVAMSRTGSDLRDDVEALRKLGRAETDELLYGPDAGDAGPLSSVAWPPPGRVGAALDVLVQDKDTAVVLDSSALPPASASRSRTPNARVQLPTPFSPVTGLVIEDVLSDLVAPSTVGWQGHRLAEQRFIAETAAIAAERPGESRTLLVAPRRTAEVVPAVAAAIIADTGRLPWLCPVPLADVAAGRERCAQLPDDQPSAAEPSPEDEEEVEQVPAADGPGADGEPPDDRDGALAPRFLERLSEVAAFSDQFTESVLLDDTKAQAETQARLLRARGRAASAAWRDQPAAGDRLLDLLEKDVALLRSKVRLIGNPVLLTGSSGVITLAVQNSLDQPVNVGVQLVETSSARLTSSATDVQVVPPGSSTPIQVRVEPRTSGRFVVEATLVDAEGLPFGGVVEIDVRSTQYGRLALAVTGLGAAVLLVAAGVRITRRALRRTAPSADGASPP